MSNAPNVLPSAYSPASDGSCGGVDGTAGARLMVAVVDDDALFREALRLNLEDAGHGVREFADGGAVVADLSALETVDLILLDWRMPGLNGIDVLRALRAHGVDVPVIFLTVLTDEAYEEAALAGGAVDFIDKSRSFTILQRRMDVIARGVKRPDPDAPTAIERSPLLLRLATKRAEWRGATVELTVREFEIVAALAMRAGEDLSFRQIYDAVHGHGFLAGDGDDGLRATVRAIIKRLRTKFKAVDPDFDAIKTFPGFGYRWQA